VSAFILLTVLSGIAGCSSSGLPERNVLVINTGLTVIATAHTDELVDVDVPLKNGSQHAVHLLRISLPSMSGVRLVRTSAYNVNHADSEFDINFGDLHVECPKQYPADAPVSAVTLPAHRQPVWFAVATVIFTKPGRYNLHEIKIMYSTAGHRGWQYQDTLLRVTVRNPPRPGSKPVPSSDACQ
jgi:hypothetical protein